jgi:hypothetical protein
MVGSGVPRRMTSRQRVFAVLVPLVTLGLGLVLTEGLLRVVERRRAPPLEGPGAAWIEDARWGWKPRKGHFRVRTPEFDVEGTISDQFMNDRPETVDASAARVRVLALGDSHTFAWGVEQDQSWVRQLETRLNAGGQGPRYRTYNAAVTGYSLHQYLLRLIDDGPKLRPAVVIVGISFATDFYDLLPPGRGGWIYGGARERDYFDLDADGRLVQRHWKSSAADNGQPAGALRLKELALDSAIGHALRRSSLTMWVASHIQIGHSSL